MKTLKMFLTILLLFSSFALAQTEFIIGAEWLNKPSDLNYELTSTDWDNISDLGLNWGMCAYTNSTKATNALNAASSNNVKIMLERYQFNTPAQGQRWQYHPEYSQHYPTTGRTGDAFDDGATLFPDDKYDEKNAWRTRTGVDLAGYITTGLIPNTEQEDNKTYYVKLRIRLGDGTQFTHTPVCTVKVVRLSDSYEKTAVIYADQFSDYNYKEITALSFYKTSTGSLLILNEENELAEVQQEAYFPEGAHSGIPQSTVLLTSGAGFDYRVYWPGNVTCFLDYVIIDDALGNSVFSGYYDTNINNEVNLFKNNTGLGRFKVRDEMDPEYYGKYLCAGYIENKIKNNVIPAGYPTKTGLHYNVGYWWLARYNDGEEYIGRDIAWTQNDQSLVDIYPISNTTVFPDDQSYTQLFQDRVQNALIKYLRPNIIYANEYSVPFWFAPQVHYLDNGLREPTTMELRLMVNLGLIYGAKGINYFLYRSDYLSAYDDQYYGLVNMDGTPRRIIYEGTSYSGDKWETVKAINQKLSGIFGTTLVNLTWQNAFSIHQGQPSGSYISSVTTPDDSDQRYVELGLFLDNSNNDYFMLVNRRTKSTESRSITVTVSKSSTYNTWQVKEVGTDNSWIVSNTGSFQTTYEPGEGKLFKFEPLFLNSSETLEGNVYVNNTFTVPPVKH